jgi:hypothetical protein
VTVEGVSPIQSLGGKDTVGEILALPWRIYPAAALMLLGAGLILAGLRIGSSDRRLPGGPEGALRYLYVFRRVVVGLAVVGIGVGWTAQVPWLFGASVCIAIGEWLESSYYISAIRWQRQARLV